jgi:hypothetical protein
LAFLKKIAKMQLEEEEESADSDDSSAIKTVVEID